MSLDFKNYATVSKEQLISSLDTNSILGLSSSEALKRSEKYGLNVVESEEVSPFKIFFRQLKSPFITLLFGASALSFFLGEARDSIYIILFITINTLLGFYQEFKSESTAKLLKSFIETSVKVIRDGKQVTVPTRLLVPGDIVQLSPGDIVQGDTRLLFAKGLTIDESILTGESVGQTKSTNSLRAAPKEIYEASNILFSGTTVVTGSAQGIVFATGHDKEVSKIVKLTTEATRVSTFEKGINSFSKFILKTIGTTLLFMVCANILVKGSAVNVPELLLFAIALAVSVIPEALPVVTTFSLSQGANRLASKKVVVKRLSAIEDLGSISVLCTDKTGTITQNKMTLMKTFSYKGLDVHYWAGLASDFLGHLSHPKDLDSFDAALLSKFSEKDRKNLDGAVRVTQLPFDPERRRTTVLVEHEGKRYLISRGAPENIFKLCKTIPELDTFEKWISKEGYDGNRIMAIAKRAISHSEKLTDISKHEEKMELVGLLAFADPLKSTTMEAVSKARNLGVQIKILTGDRPEVAAAVGLQIGLINSPDEVLTGEQFAEMDESEKEKAINVCHIFARVTPVMKYEIVKNLQKYHEVGFLGEGINDAPALKVANVGIVVTSGSDISKEAADIILLNKSLITIIEGIEEGRIVFANTVKYIKATLASNFGNFYAVAISSLFISFLPMLPIQILLVNLLSDFPMISIATDNVDTEELSSPRSYQIKEVATTATILGLVSTCFDFLVFAIFFRIAPPAILQTNWFITSILTELIFMYSIRTKKFFLKAKRPSNSIVFLTVLAAIITIGLPFTQIGITSFSFMTPKISYLLLSLGIVAAYFIATESVKVLIYKRMSKA